MISAFSFSWFIMLGIVMLMLLIAYIVLKDKSDNCKRRVVRICCIATYAMIIVYKIWAYLDPAYPFDFWTQLPIHQCNLLPIVVLLAMKQNNRWLYAYSYLGGIIGVFFAITLGASTFQNAPLLSAGGIGFYGNHFLVVFSVALPVVLKLYTPDFSDILRAISVFYIIAAFMHILNRIMNATICSTSAIKANYFYTLGADTDLTRFMQKLIPIEFVWQLCYVPIALFMMTILILPVRPWKKKNNNCGRFNANSIRER